MKYPSSIMLQHLPYGEFINNLGGKMEGRNTSTKSTTGGFHRGRSLRRTFKKKVSADKTAEGGKSQELGDILNVLKKFINSNYSLPQDPQDVPQKVGKDVNNELNQCIQQLRGAIDKVELCDNTLFEGVKSIVMKLSPVHVYWQQEYEQLCGKRCNITYNLTKNGKEADIIPTQNSEEEECALLKERFGIVDQIARLRKDIGGVRSEPKLRAIEDNDTKKGQNIKKEIILFFIKEIEFCLSNIDTLKINIEYINNELELDEPRQRMCKVHKDVSALDQIIESFNNGCYELKYDTTQKDTSENMKQQKVMEDKKVENAESDYQYLQSIKGKLDKGNYNVQNLKQNIDITALAEIIEKFGEFTTKLKKQQDNDIIDIKITPLGTIRDNLQKVHQQLRINNSKEREERISNVTRDIDVLHGTAQKLETSLTMLKSQENGLELHLSKKDDHSKAPANKYISANDRKGLIKHIEGLERKASILCEECDTVFLNKLADYLSKLSSNVLVYPSNVLEGKRGKLADQKRELLCTFIARQDDMRGKQTDLKNTTTQANPTDTLSDLINQEVELMTQIEKAKVEAAVESFKQNLQKVDNAGSAGLMLSTKQTIDKLSLGIKHLLLNYDNENSVVLSRDKIENEQLRQEIQSVKRQITFYDNLNKVLKKSSAQNKIQAQINSLEVELESLDPCQESTQGKTISDHLSTSGDSGVSVGNAHPESVASCNNNNSNNTEEITVNTKCRVDRLDQPLQQFEFLKIY